MNGPAESCGRDVHEEPERLHSTAAPTREPSANVEPIVRLTRERTTPISPATEAVLGACAALDTAISAFLSARGLLTGYAQYESTLEALNIFNLSIRSIEGVLALAREDLVLLPPAFACARAALETATKAAWMVNADDPFNREVRWLVHLQEEERVYERAAKLTADKRQAKSFSERVAQLKTFRLAVSAKLPRGTAPLRRNPPMNEMLESLDVEQLHALYIYLSQFIHGGHSAMWLYRKKGLGTEKEVGEYIDPGSWYIAFRISWVSLIEFGSLVLWRLGSRSRRFMEAARIKTVESAIELVKTGHEPALH